MRVPRGEGDWVRGSRLPTVEIHFAPGGSTGGSTPGRLDQLHFHPLRDEFDLEKKKGRKTFSLHRLSRSWPDAV